MVAKFDSKPWKFIEEVQNGDKKEDLKKSKVKTTIYMILIATFCLLLGFTIAFVLFGDNHSTENLQNFEGEKNQTEITGK